LSRVGTPPASAAPTLVRYKIDAGPSTFTVKAFRGGFLKTFGHNHTIAIREFSGTAQLTSATIQPAGLQLTVKANSLQVMDDVSDSERKKIEHTMREEVLEVGKYPDIVFKTTKVDVKKISDNHYSARLIGNLTLHGVTHGIVIDAQVAINGDHIYARGEFPVKQSDYGIKPVSVAGGTIKVKDTVKLSFNLVGHEVNE
jgi:polyisoprenoid-binding protein YceI